jgi:hypothetical protein
VVFVPGEGTGPDLWLHSSDVVSPEFMEQFSVRLQYIGQLELLAAVAVYYSLPHLFVDRQVIHWVDNTSAVAGLLKGYSSVADSARIVHAFWAIASALGSDVWFEYVPSKANIADAPSRNDCSYVESLGSDRCPFVCPPIDAWRSPAEAFEEARKAAKASTTNRKRPASP